MSILKIEEIQLHISDVLGNGAENIMAEAFFERTGIPYTRIYYNDKNAVADSLWLLNNDYLGKDKNFVKIEKLPFIKYTEVLDSVPARLSPVKFVIGLEAIKEFATFYFSIEKA